MNYPITGNLSLGNVSGNIKLSVNDSGNGNLTGIGYNGNTMTFGVNQSATDIPEMIINTIGDVNILGNVFTGGNIVVNSRAPSISTTTGALQVAGGVGIQGNLNIGGFSTHAFDSSFNGNIQLTQTNNPLWLVSRNASVINSTLASAGSDVGIFYGTTNPAAAGLVISPRGAGGGIKMDFGGNVGIGTSNPLTPLHVYRSTTGTIASFVGAGGSGTQYYLDFCTYISSGGIPTNRIACINADDYSSHYTFSSKVPGAENNPLVERMRITSAGYVGIGETNPQATLQVKSNGQNVETFRVSDVSNMNMLRIYGNLTTNGFNAISQNSDVGIIYGDSMNTTSSRLVIAPRATGPSGICMNSSGFVGIGTSNPRALLHVNYGGTNNGMISGNCVADTNNASTLLTDLTTNSIIGPSPYNNQVYMYWKNGSGLKYYWTASGTALFTGQHMVVPDNSDLKTNLTEYVGLIVSSNDTGYTSYYNGIKSTGIDAINICEALPNCKLSDKDNDKAVFGVITNQKNDEYFDTTGNPIYDNIDNGFENSLYDRIRVNSVGEGSMWVTNINGSLENGDYITSSAIPGYGKRQNDDLLHNYTVAKSTMSCEFVLNSPNYKTKSVIWEGNTYIAAFIGCTYHCG